MKFINLFTFLLFSIFGFSQLSGNVFELKDNIKYPVKSVKINIGSVQTKTNEDGRFELILPKNLPDTLWFKHPNYDLSYVLVSSQDRFVGMEIQIFSITTLGELTIQVKRDSKSINRLSPILLENLNRSEFLKAACCNLSESFETNATVDVQSTDAVSGSKKIQLLGLDGIYTHFQLENMPFLGGLESAFGLNAIPGTWLKGVSITKGTGSVVNGAESISGLINLEFLQPEKTEKFFANVYGSQFGRLEANFHASQQINKWKTATFLSGNMQQIELDRNRDNFRDLPLVYGSSVLHRWDYNSKKFETQFGFLLYGDERLGGSLAGVLNRYSANSRNKNGFFFAKTGFGLKKEGHSIGVIYQVKLHRTSAVYGLNFINSSENFAFIQPIYAGKIVSNALKFTLGINFKYQEINQKFNNFTLYRPRFFGASFGEITWSKSRFVGVLGLRSEFIERFGAVILPRLHTKFKLDERTDLRFSFGRAARVPQYLTDNQGLFVTNKIILLPTDIQLEKSWSNGVSIIRNGKILNRSASISIDYFYTFFDNQLVVDREQNKDTFLFEYRQKESYSHAFQVELSFSPIEQITWRLAFKHLASVAKLAGIFQQQVMQPKNRYMTNINFKSKNKRWDADATLSVYSPMRLHDVNHIGFHSDQLYSPYVPNLLGQITHHLNRLDLYSGVENGLNFTQKDPIVDPQFPFSNTFDATRVWGSVTGTMFYAGLRFTLK